jgi:hypothetical protein
MTDQFSLVGSAPGAGCDLDNQIRKLTIAAMCLMTSTRRFSVVLSVVLLAGLLAGQGMLRDFVLCLEVDGQVAIEPTTGPGGSCEIASTAQTRRQSSPAQWLSGTRALGQHCGPCSDVALAPANVVYPEPRRLQNHAASHSFLSVPAVPYLVYRASDFKPALSQAHSNFSVPSALPALRSTILLI